MKQSYNRVASELIPAIGYGDAAGLPTETKHAADINQRHGYIGELIPPVDNPFFKGEWGAGTTSDDTQLSLAVAESLIETGDFSITAQAQRHIEAYHETPRVRDTDGTVVRGWGHSTTESVKRLISGVSPDESGHKNGAGNGIVMKMAPLVLWQVMNEVDARARYQQYDQLTTMTHESDVARFCTRLHGDVTSSLLESGDIQAILEAAEPLLRQAEATMPSEVEIIRRAITEPCVDFDTLASRYATGKTGFKYGFYVPETLAIVYDILIGTKGDFTKSVYQAVNLGGDSDSTASIVASMAVITHGGIDQKPKDFEQVQDFEKLETVSRKLGEVGGVWQGATG